MATSACDFKPEPVLTEKTCDLTQLAADIKRWAAELGFQQAGICDVNLAQTSEHLRTWLAAGYQGEMGFMAEHGTKRCRPDELVPGTLRLISLRMDYMPPAIETLKILNNPQQAYVARYALGRDYHKLIRKRISQLGQKIEAVINPLGHRAFVDSAPVMERAIAQKSGLGWFGKNAMIINPKAGSYFLLGELFVDIPLPVDASFNTDHCGSCTRCIDICPTGAIVGDKIVDARKCISYLTIELKGPIPEDLRAPMGNRIFGCDDCQLCCPWNKFSSPTHETDFLPRHQMDQARLVDLFNWDETTFLQKTEGSPFRRAGYERWLRNIAVGLGNGPATANVTDALRKRLGFSELVDEHIQWALGRLKP